MLQNIVNITNVGKFKVFSGTNADFSFLRNTFIYGKNAKGKSTFCAILKSLSNNNPDYIIGRKTLGATGNQNVTLKTESGNLCFQNNQWNNTNIKIKLFDKEYIYKNIYSDDEIDEEKQKNIETLILGEKGRILKEEQISIESKIQENTNGLIKMTKEYNKYFNKDIFSFESFRNLSQKNFPNLDDEIELRNKELKFYREQNIVKEKIQKIKELLNININKELLKRGLEISPDILESHINSHIKPEHKEESMNFLELGNNIGNNEVCPFCGQNIGDDSKELLKIYNSIFSNEYKELNNYVKDTLLKLKMLNLGKEIELFEKEINSYIDIDFSNNIDVCVLSFINELDKKSKDLTYEIDFNKLNNLNSEIQNIISIIDEKLSKYENKDLSNEIKTTTLEIEKLRIIKRRFEPEWNDKCEKYGVLSENSKKLSKKADDKFKELKLYEQEISSGESQKINNILSKMGADFRLSEFSFPETRKGNSKLFGFEFNNMNVELKGEENEPNFKNTLSDSDKRMLAFAFFISEIQKLNDIDEYIIVFDDPMTSLDADRKKMTAEIIRDYMENSSNNKPNQVIILTHEDQFYKMLNNIFEEENGTKFLKIEEDENKNSVFKVFNKEDLQEDHFKDLDNFKKYVDGSISGCDLGKIRKGLEYIIKRKFYLEIPETEFNHGGIIKWYTKEKADEDLKRDIRDIFPNMVHHDQPDYRISESDLQENEKKRYS